MARTKTATPEENVILEETAAPEENMIPEEVDVPENQGEPMEKIFLFKDDGAYKDDLFVSVNGRNFQIQRGVEVEVPACVAEVIRNSDRQKQLAEQRLEKLVEQYIKER